MPALDVSCLLTDPDFCQEVQVVASSISVNSSGIAEEQTVVNTITAVVLPLKTTELIRYPDAELLKGGITVYSVNPLSSGDGTSSANKIIWKGATYVVYATDDYSDYGAGFYAATCQLLGLRGSSSSS